jgi:hypothetical protein
MLSLRTRDQRPTQHGLFCGLDVSVKETSVCIVDDTGKTIREVKVASEPEALLAVPLAKNCTAPPSARATRSDHFPEY